MASVRQSIEITPRFAPGATVNLGEVAAWLRMERRPVSLRAVIVRLAALPERLDFSQRIVTGTALGGEARYELHRDGTYRYSGFMRATGFPSFEFRVAALLRSADGRVQIADQHSGEVFGTDTPGPRQHDWNVLGEDAEIRKYIRNAWPAISTSTMEIFRSSDLSGVLGVTLDVLKGLVGIFVVAQVTGPGLAVCLIAGAEMRGAGAELPGLGGVAGLAIVGGSVLIFGPGAVVTALVVGVAAGNALDRDVKLRELSDDEKGFADQVFRGSIDFDRVRLTNLVGLESRKFVAPALDGTNLVNLGEFEAAPLTMSDPKYPVPGELFIHELTHAWQLQHARFEDGYVPGWICNGIVDSDYQPGPPGPAWSSFGIEAQATIVDRWFAGRHPGSPGPMDRNDSYFGYIAGNVRIGEP
jgi:hypothetical protein